MPTLTLLDGPTGTELARRGVDTLGPAWSARAIRESPDTLAEIHAAYARAGATVHTAATFRTQARVAPGDWEQLARRAVEITKASVPALHRVAGSIAPLADCYRPDLSPARSDPAGTWAEHAALARILARSGCDLLLCETFADPLEAILATEAAVGAAEPFGIPVWTSLTPGFDASLLTPETLAVAAGEAAERGAAALLINCCPVESAADYLRRVASTLSRPVDLGVYANAGQREDRWRDSPDDHARYAEAAAEWVRAGATIIGACCGGSPGLIRVLRDRLGSESARP